MAGFHYKLHIVPSDCNPVNENNFWVKEQPHSDMLKSFRKLLSKNSSWGEVEEFRSNKNYSVLYIWWTSSRVHDVEFEFAPAYEIKDELLDNVLKLCKKYKYKPYSSRSKKIIQPEKKDLWSDFTSVHPFKIYERNGLLEFN